MFIIRPIEDKDLDGLMKLLEKSGHGLTTLPKDPEVIKKRIRISQRSFLHREDGPGGEDYVFVMEELFTGRIVGVCAIISKIGGFQPYYFYKLEKLKLKSKLLHVENEVCHMHVQAVHSGPAELCSLFLDPDFRNSQNGRFLSLSRFLFIAENRKYFEDEIIAEMRGMVDDQGRSKFYDAVGKHFFKIDFPTADYLYMKDKRFIEELLPKTPITVNLLPEEAQAVVGKVHPDTEAAKRILEQEGFADSGMVAIFDPGPVVTATVNNIRSITESKVGTIGEIAKANLNNKEFIISRTEGNFRCALGEVVKQKDGKYKISDVTAAALKLRLGDSIRFVSFRPDIKKSTRTTTKKTTTKKSPT